MSIRVSVVIPCFNQGEYVADALDSIAKVNANGVEVIIVNDGSTDASTIEILSAIDRPGVTVINQENSGLAGARNAGINIAQGKYILPLDADNKLRAPYFSEAVQIMDSDPEVAMVYGNAAYFGAKTGEWRQGAFNLQKLMISNFIDACALIRRSSLLEVGLYDQNMKFMGWEDWDRWLALSFAGKKIVYIDQLAFDYRVQENSMIKKLYNQYERPNYLENYVHEKYPQQMGHQHIINYFKVRFRKNPVLFLIKLIIAVYFPRYHQRLLKKNKIRNGL